MERTLYIPGTDVYSEHLVNTETTKITAIKKVIALLGATGPVQGLIVAPDPNNINAVMVTAGHGYTYGGEYAELSTDIHNVGVSNAVQTKTYVALQITEIPTYNLPNVVTGAISPTQIENDFSIASFTNTQWYAIADKTFYMLLAIVIGSGGAVRAADINRASVSPANILFPEVQPFIITGLKIKTVSNNTTQGVGVLSWNYTTQTLAWQAPSDVGYGSAVGMGTTGIYRLSNHTNASYIDIDIDISRLPAENITENISVVDLLGQYELSLGTAVDNLHRGMMGTGEASPINPHGQSLDDFDPGTQQNMNRHQVLLHSPGIIGTPGNTSCSPAISGTQIKVSGLSSGDFLVTGGATLNQLSDSYIDFTVSDSSGLYYVYVSYNGQLKKSTATPDNQYFTVCSINWSGASFTTGVADLRKWGSISASDKAQADNDDNVATANRMLIASFSLADNLAKLRFIVQSISGEDSWQTIPGQSLKSLVNVVNTNLSAITAHIASNITPTNTVHGIKLGSGGGIDADTLRTFPPSQTPVRFAIPVSNTNGFIDFGWFDKSSLLQNVPFFKPMNSTPYYSQLANVQATSGSVSDQVGFAVQMVFGDGTVYYIPASVTACGCTATCGCTGTCSCTCVGNCGCTCTCTSTSSGSSGGGCVFWG